MTTIFVLGVFVAAEVYRVVGSQKGVIVGLKFREGAGAWVALGATADIKLKNGVDITANIPPCTLCLGRLGVGEEVRVMRSERGYSVDLPWFRTIKCSRANRRCELEETDVGLRQRVNSI